MGILRKRFEVVFERIDLYAVLCYNDSDTNFCKQIRIN